MHSSYVQVQMQIINMYIFFSVVLVLAQASLWNFIFLFFIYLLYQGIVSFTCRVIFESSSKIW